MYSLYFNKRDKKLVIEPLKASSFMYNKCTDEVTRFNDCYFMCNDRKLLREKANAIKVEWIRQLEEELQEIKEISIKNRY